MDRNALIPAPPAAHGLVYVHQFPKVFTGDSDLLLFPLIFDDWIIAGLGQDLVDGIIEHFEIQSEAVVDTQY